MTEKLTTITAVEAGDFPEDVEDRCIESDYSTHCQNDIVWVADDDNPMAVWLRSPGFDFQGKHAWIGIFAT